jgi:hypothetical protein
VSTGYLELGMLEEAAHALGQVEPEDSCRREVLGAQLNVFIATKQWDTAVTTAASMVKSEPSDPATWLILAHVMMRATHPEHVEAVLLKARHWHPKIDALVVDLARDATAMGYLVEAKVWLKCGMRLQDSTRMVALQDAEFKPLWNWLKTAS